MNLIIDMLEKAATHTDESTIAISFLLGDRPLTDKIDRAMKKLGYRNCGGQFAEVKAGDAVLAVTCLVRYAGPAPTAARNHAIMQALSAIRGLGEFVMNPKTMTDAEMKKADRLLKDSFSVEERTAFKRDIDGLPQ